MKFVDRLAETLKRTRHPEKTSTEAPAAHACCGGATDKAQPRPEETAKPAPAAATKRGSCCGHS